MRERGTVTWCRLWVVSLALFAACDAERAEKDPSGGAANPPAGAGAGAGEGAPPAASGSGVTGAMTATGTGDVGGGEGAAAGGSGAPDGMMTAAGAGGTGEASGESGAGGDAGEPPSGPDAWTMMGGDARSTYHNAGERTISVANAATLTEKWRFTVSGFPPGSPLIADGKVFVMATGATYALELETGKKLWERLDLVGTASLAYDAGFVYAHTQGARLYKVRAENGETVWGPAQTYDLASCDGTSSPIVGNGKVVVGFSCGGREVGGSAAGSRGGLTAHDAESGDKLWQHFTVPTAGEDGAMVWSSVAIDLGAGTVFATTGNNYTIGGTNSDALRAIDLASGAMPPLWSTQVRENDVWSYQGQRIGEDSDFGANPILAEVGGRKVVAAGDKAAAFWMLDRQTGEILWSRPDLSPSHNAANGGVLMNGAFDGRFFYAVSNDPTGGKAVLHKLDPTMNGASVWTQIYDDLTWGAPSLANGVLLVPINEQLLVLDAESGSMLTSFDTGGSIAAGAAAIAQGKVVVQSGLRFVFANNAIFNNQVICYGLP
jgi:outer membrane protein assembly factor BamB